MAIKKELKTQNIAMLCIDTDCGMEDAGRLKTWVPAFVEMLGQE